MLKQTTRDLIAMFREQDQLIDRYRWNDRRWYRDALAAAIHEGRERLGAVGQREHVLKLYRLRAESSQQSGNASH